MPRSTTSACSFPPPPRDHGAIVVVRPDQYVAAVLPLDAHEAVDAFFEPVLLEPAPAEIAAVG